MQRSQINVHKNDFMKFLLEGAVGDQAEMAQLDGEPVLRRGPEAAEAPFAGQQRRERRHAAVHPEQEQLPDPHVQPDGGERQHQPPHLNVWRADVDLKVLISSRDPTPNSQSRPKRHVSILLFGLYKMRCNNYLGVI